MLAILYEKNKYGYACLTSHFQSNIYQFRPLPFLTFQLDESTHPSIFKETLKLPTWFCNDEVIND
jgi:hypothetical protein